jgi:hypothetical protein
MREEIERLIKLLYKVPITWAVLKSVDIAVSSKGDAVEVSDYIALPATWRTLPQNAKLLILARAAFHIARRDPWRMWRFASANEARQVAYAVAAEAKVVHLLQQIMPYEAKAVEGLGWVTLEEIAEAVGRRVIELEKMSTEDIARLLLSSGKRPGGRNAGNGFRSSIQSGGGFRLRPPLGEARQGLELVMPGTTRSEGDISSLVYRIVAILKQAGTTPGWLDRFVEDLDAPRVDWRSMLRSLLRPLDIKKTWMRPNRRGLPLPGYRYNTTLSRVWVLVDISGSISDVELRAFFTELFAINRNADVVAVLWDVGVRGVFRLRRASAVEDLLKIKAPGGGGTVLKPVIQYVMEKWRPPESVIILTDGHWSDAEDGDLIQMLEKLGAIIVTTSEAPRCRCPVVRLTL